MLADLTSMIQTIKEAGRDAVNAEYPVAIMFGVVIGIDPLSINVEQKMTLDAPKLIVPKGMTDSEIDMKISFTTFDALDTHEHDYSGVTDIENIPHVHEFSGTTANAGSIDPHDHDFSGTSDVTDPAHPHTYNGTTEIVDLTHPHDFSGILRVTLYNGLRVNDEVILLRVQGGQKFLILDRVG